MKIVKLFTIAFILNIIISFNVRSQDISDQSENAIQYIDSLANAFYPSAEPGLSLLISKNGIPLFVKTYGLSDIKDQDPITADNVFAIGSMSKQFTAVGILMLANEGKLNLSDNIKIYLPQYNTHGKEITIKQCLTHSSGILSFTEKEGFDSLFTMTLSKDEMIGFFENDDLLFEPGSDFSYSNSGYLILGMIIEKISGMDYNDFIRKNIFEPAGMTNSYFYGEENMIPVKAIGYDGRDSSTYKETSQFYNGWTKGAGNIKSCVNDLLLWNNFLINGKLIPEDLIQEAFTPNILSGGVNSNYGFGWNVTMLENKKIIRHGGAINGFLSDAVYLPEDKIYIVALSNNTGKSPGKLMDNIVLKTLNLTGADPEIIAYDKNSFDQYEGSYEIQREGGRLMKNFSKDKQYRFIFEENDSLKLQRTGGGLFTLLQYGKDKFFIESSDKRFEFIRDNNGNVSALEVSDYPVTFGPADLCLRSDAERPKEKEVIIVSEDVLKNYEGEFELQPGFNLKIFLENGELFIQATGQQKLKLYAENTNKFFLKEVDAQVEFIQESDNKFNKLLFTQGQQMECLRIK
ncbi:MAG TPA: serine hydrolase [Ignavibacteria bacterium]|nr:serine hydrolase [Ignavibacteria bacterium]HMR40112.1 serine hydrolase [Ignavibacteria bacterium]